MLYYRAGEAEGGAALGSFASQDFDISLRNFCVEVLQRIAETVIYPSKMTEM